MSSLSDEALARILQAEFDEEYQVQDHTTNVTDSYSSVFNQVVPSSSSVGGSPAASNSKPLSLIDTQWELLDPTPDPRALFLQFNDRFFWGKLAGVEVRWSPRMTLCAGVCSYEGRGGLCSIRLSVPLLKLRPRKDLVETLLHEMIHAYLFVTQNNRDRDGHGPEFCKHKDRINKASGTRITIYHSFHDEVDNYRQHWWRCDGPCQRRKPFFGYVKRAMNRAPAPRDPWWADHQRTCGGTFTKIKEPEGYGIKKRKKKDEDSEAETENEAPGKKPKRESRDIREFIPFSGQGRRLGGSDDRKVQGESSEVPQRQNGLPSQRGSNSHPLENCGSDESHKTLMKDKTNISIAAKVHDENQSQKTFFQASHKDDSLVHRRKGKDPESRRKKLEELKAIFVSSSEDEDDGGAASQGKEKKKSKMREKKALLREEDENGAREEESKQDRSPWRKIIRYKDKEPQDKRVIAGTSTMPGSSLGTMRKSPHSSRSPVKSPGEASQSSLHQMVERMKRLSGETGRSSEGPVFNNDESGTSINGSPTVCCPVCGSRVMQSHINTHLDSCLSG